MIRILILVIGCIIIARTDQLHGKIYNWVTYPMLISGLVLSLIEFSLESFLFILGSLVVLYFPLWLFVKIDYIGGGDAMALLSVISLMPFYAGWLTNIFFLKVLLYSMLVIVIVNLFQKAIWFYLNTFVKKETSFNKILDTRINQVSVKYGVYLLVAVVLALFF